MEQIIGFDELRWLQQLTHRTQKPGMPGAIGERLLARGLIAPRTGGFELTARGRIALAKLA
jgi:hypothetical protein